VPWDTLLAGSGLARLEARALLESATGRSRSWLIAHGDEAATQEATLRFGELARRRRAGEPLSYLTGWREFHGLALRVDPSVLIPRADTEKLVELAIALAPASARLLELGTGSGAIAIALAAARSDLRVTATDLSQPALELAKRNAAEQLDANRTGGPLRWLLGSWWLALPADEPAIELIVSNPPYLRADDPHLSRGDLRYEPAMALASGPDGLDAIRAIIDGAPPRLAPQGWLLLEHGFDQAETVRTLLGEAGWRDIATHRDAEGRERATLGQRPIPPRLTMDGDLS
jgi:release factor glutamine methyltransferase